MVARFDIFLFHGGEYTQYQELMPQQMLEQCYYATLKNSNCYSIALLKFMRLGPGDYSYYWIASAFNNRVDFGRTFQVKRARFLLNCRSQFLQHRTSFTVIFLFGSKDTGPTQRGGNSNPDDQILSQVQSYLDNPLYYIQRDHQLKQVKLPQRIIDRLYFTWAKIGLHLPGASEANIFSFHHNFFNV